MLSNEELITKYQDSNDEKYLVELYEKNEKLLYHTANKYERVYADNYDDVVSEAKFGFIKAVKTFDVSKGFQFVTYAMRVMENQIGMYYRKHKRYKNEVSIDTELGIDKDGNKITIYDIVPSEMPTPEEITNKDSSLEVMLQLIEKLPKADQIIIKGLYFCDEPLTQKEISKKLGISQSYISRKSGKVLQKIKKLLEE